jgi:hypothetical protein
MCQELGVWPEDFSEIVRAIAVPEKQINTKQVTEEMSLVVTQVNVALGVLDVSRMIVEYTLDSLPGTVKHQEVAMAEYLEDDQGLQSCSDGGFESWDVREVSITDNQGRAWRMLHESSDDGEYLCLELVRCAKTGLPLSVTKSLDGSQWVCGLQSFVFHPIATEFALSEAEQDMPSTELEDLTAISKRWEDASRNKLDAGGIDMLKRLRAVQQRIAIHVG